MSGFIRRSVVIRTASFCPGNLDNPNVLYTKADAKVNNYAGYAQNSMEFFNGHFRVEAGLRFDYFTFDVNGFELGGIDESAKIHCPKFSRRRIFAAAILQSDYSAKSVYDDFGRTRKRRTFAAEACHSLSPFEAFPMSFYVNYGRGIASQDARGVVRSPDAPKSFDDRFLSSRNFIQLTSRSAVFTLFY
jgi:outer membrane receptor protein involved in Fe transport